MEDQAGVQTLTDVKTITVQIKYLVQSTCLHLGLGRYKPELGVTSEGKVIVSYGELQEPQPVGEPVKEPAFVVHQVEIVFENDDAIERHIEAIRAAQQFAKDQPS